MLTKDTQMKDKLKCGLKGLLENHVFFIKYELMKNKIQNQNLVLQVKNSYLIFLIPYGWYL